MNREKDEKEDCQSEKRISKEEKPGTFFVCMCTENDEERAWNQRKKFRRALERKHENEKDKTQRMKS